MEPGGGVKLLVLNFSLAPHESNMLTEYLSRIFIGGRIKPSREKGFAHWKNIFASFYGQKKSKLTEWNSWTDT